MILDKHGKPMTQDEQFESYASDDLLTGLQGDSQQVLSEAIVLDTGAALTESDLFTAGSYTVHHVPGVYIMEYHKDPAAKTEWFEVKVYDYARQEFERELQEMKDAHTDTKSGEKPIYHIAPWIMADLLMNHDVHPEYDEVAFEKKLWEQYPQVWIDETKAPKY